MLPLFPNMLLSCMNLISRCSSRFLVCFVFEIKHCIVLNWGWTYTTSPSSDWEDKGGLLTACLSFMSRWSSEARSSAWWRPTWRAVKTTRGNGWDSCDWWWTGWAELPMMWRCCLEGTLTSGMLRCDSETWSCFSLSFNRWCSVGNVGRESREKTDTTKIWSYHQRSRVNVWLHRGQRCCHWKKKVQLWIQFYLIN